MGDAVKAAEAAARLAHQASAVVDAYAEAARVASNPHENANAQKALQGIASSEADKAAAKLALDLANAASPGTDPKGDDATPEQEAAVAASEKAAADRATAQEHLDKAVMNGDLDLSETTYPHCPSPGVAPKKPPCICMPACTGLETPVLRYGPPDTPECLGLADPDEGSSKGSGPPSEVDPGATSDVHGTKGPAPTPLPQDESRTFARGPDGKELEKDRITVDKNGTIRVQYRDPKGTFVTEETYPPQSQVVAAGVVRPSPGSGSSSKDKRRRDAARKEQKRARKPTIAELREKRRQQIFTQFIGDMRRRAQAEDAALGRPGSSAWDDKVIHAAFSHFREIEGLIESRITIEESIATLAAELAGGDVSSERKREIDLLDSKLQLADAQAKFDMVEKAGARQLPESIQEAIDVVNAAMEADRLHVAAGVEDPGFLKSATQLSPQVGDILRHHSHRNLPAAEAAREAWSDAEPGVGDFLKNLWINATGGPDATPGQRIAIFAATVAIGLATAGVGSVAMSGMSTLARVGMTALIGVTEGALQSAARQAITSIDDPDGIKISAKEVLYEGLVSGAFAGIGASLFGAGGRAAGMTGEARVLSARVSGLEASGGMLSRLRKDFGKPRPDVPHKFVDRFSSELQGADAVTNLRTGKIKVATDLRSGDEGYLTTVLLEEAKHRERVLAGLVDPGLYRTSVMSHAIEEYLGFRNTGAGIVRSATYGIGHAASSSFVNPLRTGHVGVAEAGAAVAGAAIAVVVAHVTTEDRSHSGSVESPR